MSVWALEAFAGSAASIHKGIRDRAMLLISTNVAFRGDSTRRVTLSDIFTRDQPMEIIRHGATLPVSLSHILRDLSRS